MLSDRPQNSDAHLDDRCKILCLWKPSHWRWIHVWILWLFYFCHFFFQLWKIFSFGFVRGFNIAVHINSKIVVQCFIFNSKFHRYKIRPSKSRVEVKVDGLGWIDGKNPLSVEWSPTWTQNCPLSGPSTSLTLDRLLLPRLKKSIIYLLPKAGKAINNHFLSRIEHAFKCDRM